MVGRAGQHVSEVCQSKRTYISWLVVAVCMRQNERLERGYLAGNLNLRCTITDIGTAGSNLARGGDRKQTQYLLLLYRWKAELYFCMCNEQGTHDAGGVLTR